MTLQDTIEKYMKALRKYFNYPSRKEAILIEEGCNKLVAIAEDWSNKHYSNEKDIKRKEDGTCPNCGKNNIVNKFAMVEGSGHISGSFALGFGDVYSRSGIKTHEVNHCNNCGNQWKKYNINHRSADTIIAGWLDYLSAVYKGEYSFGDWIIELFKDIPAESIWKEFNRVSYICSYSTRERLSLSLLRTKFKSVYK